MNTGSVSKKKSGAIAGAKQLYRSFSYIENRTRYFAGAAFSSLELGILFAVPVINQKLVEMATGTAGTDTVQMVALLFAALLLLLPLIAVGKYWQNTATTQGTIHMRKAMFAHMQEMSVADTVERRTGDYISRLTSDVERAGNVFASFGILSFIRFLVIVPVTLFLLFQTDWRIAVVAVVFNLICFYLSTIFNPFVKRLEQDAREQSASSSSYLLEAMRGIPVIRLFLLKDILGQKYTDVCSSIRRKRIAFRSMNGIAYGVIDFFIFSAQIVGLLTGVLLMKNNGPGFATCVYAASLMGLMSDGMLRFSSFLLLIQPSLVASKRVFEVLDTQTEESTVPDGRLSRNDIDSRDGAAIVFEHVSFAYPGTDRTVKVIDDLNLSIRKNEKLAIVGGSGGGKSTLVKLLQGFYIPTEGKLSLFGMDSGEMSKAALRSLASYVPQECEIFDGTILSNIGLGSLQAEEGEIIQAARAVHLDEFIQTLPEGYHSIVGERGSQLSGGQRQRVAIARAILKDAPVILLDESTSALDSALEKEIYQDLDILTKDKTVISIAHRLSTIQNADRIIVMDGGKIVEEGTHEELLAKKGYYHKLAVSAS